MPQGLYTPLAERSVLRITGKDARSFLQGLVTNDVGNVSEGRAVYASLLTPQGKILFDFFLAQVDDDFLLDCAAARLAELQKRLTFYRLRAAVGIDDASETHEIGVAWGDDDNFGLGTDAGRAMMLGGGTVYVDPRTAAAGARAIVPRGSLAQLASTYDIGSAGPEGYHAHRIALGLADSDADIGSGELFPHESNLDQLNGVDFKKGCFVGQEVVSRTQHRASARKRILPVTFAEGLAAKGAEISAGEKSIGTVLSGVERHGLALVRLDRAQAAFEAGTALSADGRAVVLAKPAWARFDVPGAEREA